MRTGKITEHFTWEEMQASATAKRKGIDNSIPTNLQPNMEKLCKEILEPIREAYGKPIIVGSGYRCPRLNKLCGGVANSQHKTAAAADIHSLSDTVVDNQELWGVIMKLIEEKKIVTRQCIDEYNYNWIHISCADSQHTPKTNQILHIK